MSWRKCRKSAGLGRAVLALCLLGWTSGLGLEPAYLPIYLEDSHAGSFYWFAQSLDLEEEATLVLFDAHSDASQLFDSDRVRRELRGSTDIAVTLARWRSQGAVQCFNWIEPLMPRPFARVIWVAPDEFDRDRCLEEVKREIEAHEMVTPRKGGPLADRFEVMTVEELGVAQFEHPVVISLDLDFFAENPDEKLETCFDAVWDSIFRLPGLRGISAAISTPYLKSEEQADRLVCLFLQNSLGVTNAAVQWEPFASIGPDRSRKAKELMRKGAQIPAFSIEAASPELRALVASHRGRVRVDIEPRRWEATIAAWQGPRIGVSGRRPDHDGCVRVRKKEGCEVRLAGPLPDERIEWFALVSEHDTYNLLGDGTRFAGDAPRWIRWKWVSVGGDRPWIDEEDLRPVLDEATGCGTARVLVKVGGLASNEVVIRFSQSNGFRGAVEETFALPYVLGGSRLAHDGFTGSDLALGGDCANLAVYALRRTQRHLRWMTPVELRPCTEAIDSFGPSDLDRGLFADFGSHLAVLMEDLPPLGRFNDEDRFAHHLEGRPEIVTLRSLQEGRRKARFCRLARPANEVTLVVAGDTMLARTVGDAIEEGEDPFAGVKEVFRSADLAVVNLECAVGDGNSLPPKKARYRFVAPPKAVDAMNEAGIDLVSLANNHANDGDLSGTLDSLEGAGVAPFGIVGALFQVREMGDLRIAFAGWQPGESFDAIREARKSADLVVVMPHWGTEHQRMVDEAQVTAAAEMVEAGAGLIVGSGPHCVQKFDRIGKVPVFYSLGNFVFDGDGPNEDWKRGLMLRITIGPKGEVFAVDELPVRLGEDGFPTLPSTDE